MEDLEGFFSKLSIDFIVSPFSELALDWSIKLKVDALKIGSGEVSNYQFLNKISESLDSNIPILLSSGMSNYSELNKAYKILSKNNRPVYPMQCTSKYPTEPKDWGLENVQIMKNKYSSKVGFSDHSGEIFASLAAVTLGADIIETHLVYHKECFGPDTSSSITLESMKLLVNGIRSIKKSLNNKYNKDVFNDEIINMKRLFEKKLIAKRNINKGEIFSSENIIAKKGCKNGILANKYEDLCGLKAKKNYLINEPIEE